MALVVSAGVVAWAGSGTGRSGPAESPPRSPQSSAATEDWIAGSDDDAVFTVDCHFSHRAPDDPIVHPGAPGASHSHEFFGSTATDALSTGPSLLGTPTTCQDRDDTAAYWVPTLSVDGVPVEPTLLRAYYRARRGTDVRDVTAPPLGLAMISGHPDRTVEEDPTPTTVGPVGDDGHAHHGGGVGEGSASDGDGLADVGWGCGLRPRQLWDRPPEDCTAISPLTLQLRFPDCWDGRALDSPDHRSHVARSVGGACPSTHPVLMTEVQVSVSWPVTGTDGARVTIDSGPVSGAHGDFLNGWDPDVLARRVELCIWAKANCTIG